MATLTVTQKTGYDIAAIAPQGQYLAVCLKIEDKFGVARTKFQSTEEESRDVTRFLFGLKDLTSGAVYLVQTYEYTISGLPNSNLMKFLTQWLGAQPQIGWDYCELENSGCMLTIAHKEAANTPGKFYAKIMSIAPVMAQLAGQVPHASEFQALIDAAKPDDVTAGTTPPVATGAAPVAAPVATPPAPAVVPQAAPPVAETTDPAFPYGWTAHPQAPGQYYQGQEVLTEADLRARFEPAPVAAPVATPPAPAVVPQAAPPVAETTDPVVDPNAPPFTPDPAPAPAVATPPAPTPPVQAGPPAGNPF